MKLSHILTLFLLTLFSLQMSDKIILGVTFTSDTLIDAGDYTYDANDIIVDGCTLTINGPHLFSNLHIFDGGILTHSQGVDSFNLTITDDLTVDPGGMISADGLGYGPMSGPGAGSSWPSFRSGGGGGYGGMGGDGANWADSGGITYGSITEPVDLGSGGGYSGTAGSGGGALRLSVVGTLMLDGTLATSGSAGLGYHDAGGSGGSIYVIASVITGSGMISADGGDGGAGSGGGGGGGGRIAIYI